MPRKRARSTWGSNTDAGNGRRRLRFWADLHDGRGYVRHSATIVGSRRDGDEYLARVRVEHSADAPVPTVAQLWESFELPRLREGVSSGKTSQRTLTMYTSYWERMVGPRWGRTPSTDVRAYDIQQWLLGMTKSNGEVARAVLRLTLDHALMLDVIPSNPASRRFRLGDDSARREEAYTQDELSRLWEVVRGSVCEAPFLLSSHAGLRVGEACGVTLDDCEWREDGTLVVSVRRQLLSSGGMTDRLKTRSSYRTVAVVDPWSSRIREIVDALPTCARYVNDRGDGEPVCRKTVSDTWARLVRATDVPYRSMQVLRPSFQTALHWAGVPIEQTSRMLGHSSTSTTLDHYDRPGTDAVINAMVDAEKKAMHRDDLGQSQNR